MNDAEYNALPGIRRSDLWIMNQTPAHFRWRVDHPDEPTPALIFGQAAHKYMLEPDTFFDEFEVVPKVDRRTKAGKEILTAFEQMHEGKVFITNEDMQKLLAMREALLQNPTVKEILTGEIRTEVPFTWIDPQTQEPCKVKIDILAEQNGAPIIADYKTTTSCADGAFERSVRKYGYDFQAGMYTEGVRRATLEDREFLFIAQEKDPPYVARVYWCNTYMVERGMRTFHDLLNKYAECKRTNSWPGYEDTELFEEEW